MARNGVVRSPEVVTSPGAAAHVLAFGWRALLKIKHMPEQLFDMVVTPVMFTVLFTYLFGGALAGSPQAYLQYLLPGILAQTVLFTTVYTAYTLNTDLSRGIYDRFRSMPIWKPAPLAGALVGDLVRFTVSSIVVVAIGLVLGYRPQAGLPGMVAAVVLLDVFALGIGWIFVVVALVVRAPGTVATLSWLVMMPLTFASNVYVDPATMPAWLQAFVAINPVSHLVTALRGLLGGGASAPAIGWALLAPAGITAIFAPVALRLYDRRQ